VCHETVIDAKAAVERRADTRPEPHNRMVHLPLYTMVYTLYNICYTVAEPGTGLEQNLPPASGTSDHWSTAPWCSWGPNGR
jgi:hypothetical protein